VGGKGECQLWEERRSQTRRRRKETVAGERGRKIPKFAYVSKREGLLKQVKKRGERPDQRGGKMTAGKGEGCEEGIKNFGMAEMGRGGEEDKSSEDGKRGESWEKKRRFK